MGWLDLPMAVEFFEPEVQSAIDAFFAQGEVGRESVDCDEQIGLGWHGVRIEFGVLNLFRFVWVLAKGFAFR